MRFWLALWLAAIDIVPAAAQTVEVISIKQVSAPVGPPSGLARAQTNAPSMQSAFSLSGPRLIAAPSAPRLHAIAQAKAVSAVPDSGVVAVLAAPNQAETPQATLEAVSEAPVAAPEAKTVSPQSRRQAAVAATVETGVAQWGPARRVESLPIGGVSQTRVVLSPALEAPRTGKEAAPPAAARPELSRAKPVAARSALIVGAVLIGASAVAFAFPALTPAVLAAWKGPVLWAGLATMSLSRFWKVPGEGVETPRGPPEEAKGFFKSVKNVWRAASQGAASQIPLEAKVGGSSVKSFRDWLLGGLRAAALWMPVAIATMMAGWGLAKPLAGLAHGADPVGTISFEALEKLSLGGHLLGYVAGALSAQAATLAVFEGARWLARRFGAGRATDWVAGAAALLASAALILTVTTTPAIVGTLLGIEAGLLWLRARSNSWLAPMALRLALTLLTLESARFAVSLFTAAAGALKGLPEIWTGVAVAGLLAVNLLWDAWGKPAKLWASIKMELRRVTDFKAWLSTPAPGGAPRSPWPLVKLASLWGLVLYALGDGVYNVAHAVFGGVEPTPAILVQMLRSPVDLVLYNFLLVGFLEEFVFRRGLFKSMANRLAKWGVTGQKAFWIAAVVSSLIFSYAHYIDFGAVFAKLGLADAAASSGLGGTYAFTVAGFAARAVLGVALAWLYAASGTLLLPIIAHFLADSFEGLGLRWGIGPFLAMAAAALIFQHVWKKPSLEPGAKK